MSILQYRHRERHRAPVTRLGDWHSWWLDNSPVDGTLYGYLDQEFSEVFDENHGHDFVKTPGPDNGGTFDLYRTTVQHLAAPHALYRPVGGSTSRGKAYSGRICATEPVTPEISSAQAAAKSAAASLWNKARPAKPLMEGLNAFYELKDVPGMLQQRFRHLGFGEGLGSTYLSYQFGWKPLLDDIKKFYLGHLQLKQYLDQLLRDEGKAVRRRAELPRIEYETSGDPVQSYGAFYPSFVTQMYHEVPWFQDTLKYTERRWMSAAFKYWLPSGDRLDWRWYSWMVARIFGFNPTPSRVYAAIPWTWLFDWFSNVGQIIEASSSGVEEKLATDYCYYMAHIKATRTRTSHGIFYGRNDYEGLLPVTSVCSITREHKSRFVGGVFEPSLTDPSGLTMSQLSILGALGLSTPSRR